MFSGFLLDIYKKTLPPGIMESLLTPVRQAIRPNTLKVDENRLVLALERKGVRLEKISWTNGYFVNESPFSIGATTEYLLGYYFIQDPTSIYACEVLAPEKGETVLDMTAAPGGKTTCLAQLMENQGTIISLEINRERMRALRSNITRMGVMNVIAIRMDSLDVEELGIKFDKILLDAPCTGTGTVFKNPKAAKKEKEDVINCTKIQRSLLEKAYTVLNDGGTVVYSTCSLLPEENEIMVEYAMDMGFRIDDIPYGEDAITGYNLSNHSGGEDIGEDIKKAKRFYPGIHGTQGFFIAKLRR